MLSLGEQGLLALGERLPKELLNFNKQTDLGLLTVCKQGVLAPGQHPTPGLPTIGEQGVLAGGEHPPRGEGCSPLAISTGARRAACPSLLAVDEQPPEVLTDDGHPRGTAHPR